MPTSRAQKSSHPTASATRPARDRRRPAAGRLCREAWITDPQTLLDAIGSAEAEAIGSQQACRVVAPCHTPSLESSTEPAEQQKQQEQQEQQEADDRDASGAWGPQLRDDERIGRASPEGVVVIIRRRRVAA
jgi:hypothetical protein